MNELKIFNNEEFGRVRTVLIGDHAFFVGKDIAEILGYTDTFGALKKHVDEEDKQNCQNDSFESPRGMTVINESGMYSLVISSKLPNAKRFKRWVTAEVLPSIRETGIYGMPRSLPEALRAYAAEVEEKEKLLALNQAQEQIIAEFKPVKEYVDVILSSANAVTITQIAADYGLSAKRLNQILHDAGLIYKVGGQWILYVGHMNKGYTKSETITITRSDGRLDTKMNTKWTQKGRLKVHEILTGIGIKADMEK